MASESTRYYDQLLVAERTVGLTMQEARRDLVRVQAVLNINLN